MSARDRISKLPYSKLLNVRFHNAGVLCQRDRIPSVSQLCSLQFVASDWRNLRFRLLDAKDQPINRVADRAAYILQGLDKPIYEHSKDNGDIVVIVNAKHVQMQEHRWM